MMIRTNLSTVNFQQTALPHILGRIQDIKQKKQRTLMQIQFEETHDIPQAEYDTRETCAQFQQLPPNVKLASQLRLYQKLMTEQIEQMEQLELAMDYIESNCAKLERNLCKLQAKWDNVRNKDEQLQNNDAQLEISMYSMHFEEITAITQTDFINEQDLMQYFQNHGIEVINNKILRQIVNFFYFDTASQTIKLYHKQFVQVMHSYQKYLNHKKLVQLLLELNDYDDTQLFSIGYFIIIHKFLQVPINIQEAVYLLETALDCKIDCENNIFKQIRFIPQEICIILTEKYEQNFLSEINVEK